MQNILSIVIPIFNEEENIPILYKELNKSLTKTKYRREIIFVNDGSQDSSLQKIKKLISKDKNIKVISFSRNFGHMAAIDAGLKHASGQKIVLMDADMQDPPSVIPLLLKKSMEGFDVVYGIKEKRKEGLVRRIMFNSFYHILNSLVIHKMPLNAGTFSVLDRKIVDILVSLPEKNKYVSGLRAWVMNGRFTSKPWK
jgi:dolichol-phosphate mannosyltransferase